jgi:hypothetical protein
MTALHWTAVTAVRDRDWVWVWDWDRNKDRDSGQRGQGLDGRLGD